MRAWFLEHRSCPKVIKKDEVLIRTLIYNLRKNEGGGVCHVHALPERSNDIEKWLERLQITGLQYRGEGLPSMSLRVLQTLVKGVASELGSLEKRRHKFLKNMTSAVRCARVRANSSSIT